MDKYFAVLLLFAVINQSCKKENIITSPITSNSFRNNTIEEDLRAGKYVDKTSGNVTFVLQPGTNGEDAWVKRIEAHPVYADSNYGNIEIIKALTWKESGFTIFARSLIKFEDLNQIPASAQIVSANLFLYGLTSPSTHLPMGDSYYPGSPYSETNTVLVQRVTSSWSENSVSWNNQPSATSFNQSPIPPSTGKYNYDVNVDVSKLVSIMIQNPSSNYGFRLRLETEKVFRSMGFYSSEYSDASKHPKLVVVYK